MASETNRDMSAKLGTNMQPHCSSNGETLLLTCKCLELTCRKESIVSVLEMRFVPTWVSSFQHRSNETEIICPQIFLIRINQAHLTCLQMNLIRIVYTPRNQK